MGIGYGGKELEEMLNEDERAFRETGHYFGLKELKNRDSDLAKYERLHSRLLSLVVGARESVRYIASSPGTKEVGELVFALYTPEGDGVVFSTGIMAHVCTLAEFIKWLIRNKYEDDPGIIEGRYFETNECWAGGLHCADVLQVTPIFWKNQLVGWSGGVTHEMDLGAYQPAVPALCPTRFLEGFHLLGEVVAENNQLKKDYVLRCQHNLRLSHMWIMDAKVKLSGNYMIREGVKKVIEDFGIEYYMKTVRELIEETHRAFTEKVKRTLIPGKYRSTGFLPLAYGKLEGLRWLHPLCQQDSMIHLPIEITIQEDGRLKYDFDGASPQGYHCFHATPTLLRGGLWITITQNTGYDVKVSHGSNLAIDIDSAPGSVVNPTNKQISTADSWPTLCTLFTVGSRLLSNVYFSRGFLEEVFLMNSNAFQCIGMADQLGGIQGAANMELSSPGSGGKAVADGLDGAWCLWNPESNTGNIETWETVFPKFYLARSYLKDDYAPGRFRGGVSWNSLLAAWKSNFMYVCLRCGWTCGTNPVDKGLFGGYPAPTSFGFALKDTNFRELIQKKEKLPRDMHELVASLKGGKLKAGEVHFYKTHEQTPALKTYDMWGVLYAGGAGYGDPIERDPELSRKDVENGLASLEFVEKIHGIVLRGTEKELNVDLDATQERRNAMRKERLEKAIPAGKYIEQQRERILAKKLPEFIIQCYSDAIGISEKFKGEFYEFWNLPRDFEL